MTPVLGPAALLLAGPRVKQEVGASWQRFASDIGTAFAPGPDDQRTPPAALPPHATLLDHAWHGADTANLALSGGTRRAPGGERAAAAERAIPTLGEGGEDVYDIPQSVVRGLVKQVGEMITGRPVSDQDAAGWAAAIEVGAPIVGKVAGPVGRGLATAGERPIAAVRGALERGHLASGYEPGEPPTPEMREHGQEAGTRVVAGMARRLDPTGEKLGASAMEARGKPVTAAEALGRPAETALGAAGRRMGQTPDVLEAQLRARQSETAQRVVEDFSGLTGIDADTVEGDFVAHAERLRAQAGPLYDQAYNSGPVDTPELRAFLDRDVVKKALVRARRIASNEGRNPNDVGLVTQTVMKGTNLRTSGGQPMQFPVEEQVEVRNPTMQTWDYIKRGLDDELEGYRDKTTRRLNLDTEGRSVALTLHQLRDELTNPGTAWGPKYRAALDAGGEPLRLEEAFNGARRLLSPSTSLRQFNTSIDGYSPAQIDALKAGIINRVRNAAAARDPHTARQGLGEMMTPDFRAKMTRLFGHDVAEQINQRIEDERFLLAHGARMMPGTNSVTSETLMADTDQAAAVREMTRVAGHAVRGHWLEALTRLVGTRVDQMVSGAQLPLDEATRDVVGALLTQKPSELARVLQEHGATAAQASHEVALLEQSGFFTPHVASVLAVINSQMGPKKRGAAATPPAATPPKSTNPYADLATASDAAPPPAAPSPPAADAPAKDAEPAPYTPRPQVASYLQYHLGVPVRITGDARTPERNREVGGAENSAHLHGEAWDFVPVGMDLEGAAQKLAASGILFDQIEIADRPPHLHISFDPRNRGQIVRQGHGHRAPGGETDFAEGGMAPPQAPPGLFDEP